MSDYRGEQSLTYVGAPFFVLLGLYFVYRSVDCFVHAPGHIEMGIMNAILGLALTVYGAYFIREGRRRLREGPWRAEHFMP